MDSSTFPRFIQDPNPGVYLNGSYIVLDVECTNLDNGSPYTGQNRLLLASWLHSRDAVTGKSPPIHSVWGDEFGQSRLCDAIAGVDFVIAHNTKFELGWLSRCGVDLRRVLTYCTQIGEYVFAGNRKLAGGLSLAASCARYGISGKRSFVSSLMEAGICPSEMPRAALQEYCEQDVRATYELFLRQRSRLAELKLLPVAYARNLLTPVLADIEPRGMYLDKERVLTTHADYSIRYNKLMAEFNALTGGLNPRSGKQMGEFLYTKLAFEEVKDNRGTPIRTSGGRPKTDKKVLPLLKATTKEQEEFLAVYKELAKLKIPVQNLEKMRKICEAGDPVVYAALNQTVTATHRLSSSGRKGGFQFQNFDRAFKPLFKARREGWKLVEGDAPQLEFRVAAFLGQDPVAIQDIREGADIHALTAASYKVSRQEAKALTFRPLYGATGGSKKDKAYYEAFRSRYKGIYETQNKWTHQVLQSKQLRAASGLIFYWPDTDVSRSGYITNTTSIFNYPVQSFATADIVPLTLILLWHAIAGMQSEILNTIHDSILAEVPENEIDKYKRCLIDCTVRVTELLRKIYGVDFNVPLGVGVKVAEHWGEGDEEKFNGTEDLIK